MKCNEEIHDELVKMEFLSVLWDKTATTTFCCDKQNLINDNGSNICKSCGAVNDYQIAKEYINFYETVKYNTVKKSICERNIIWKI